MKAPFSSLTSVQRRRWLIGALGLTIALQAALIISGAGLWTDAAPCGIISFEFAGTPDRADAMLKSWEQHGVVAHAAFNLGLDYAFLLAYAVALALACIAVADLLKTRAAFYARVGVMLAWASFGAAGLDAIENAALLQIVFGAKGAVWPVVAYGSALLKFIIVGLGIVYVIAGLGMRYLRRR